MNCVYQSIKNIVFTLVIFAESITFAHYSDSHNLDLISNNSTPTWIVFENEEYFSYPCIKLEGIIEFSVVSLTDFVIVVPKSATSTGHCEWEDYQDIKLTWTYDYINGSSMEGGGTNLHYALYSIYFGFSTKLENLNEFALTSVTIVVEMMIDDDGTLTYHPKSYSVSDFTELSTPKNKAFTCSNIQIQVGDLALKLSNLKVQAFNKNENDLFNNEFQCEMDRTTVSDEGTNYWIGLFLVGFFSLCFLGVVLALFVGSFNKRRDIVAIGYRFVGTNNQASGP